MENVKEICGSARSTLYSLLFLFLVLASFGIMGLAFYLDIVLYGVIQIWQLALIFYGIMILAIGTFMGGIYFCRYIPEDAKN